MEELTLNREYEAGDATLGRLFWGNEAFCYSLEPLQRAMKLKGKTAIPLGRYKVIVDFSNRFQKELPHILDVPNFEGVRFHGLNFVTETQGCVGIGALRKKDTISNCAGVVEELTRRIKDAGHVWLTITSNFPVDH